MTNDEIAQKFFRSIVNREELTEEGAIKYDHNVDCLTKILNELQGQQKLKDEAFDRGVEALRVIQGLIDNEAILKVCREALALMIAAKEEI